MVAQPAQDEAGGTSQSWFVEGKVCTLQFLLLALPYIIDLLV